MNVFYFCERFSVIQKVALLPFLYLQSSNIKKGIEEKKSTSTKVYYRGQVGITRRKLIEPFLYTLGKLFHSELKSSLGVLKYRVPACTL